MISTEPKFKLKLHCLKFSLKTSFLPTMADDHTSEASEWLGNQKLQKYCEYLRTCMHAIIHQLTITMDDCTFFLSHADCANGHACFVGEVGTFFYLTGIYRCEFFSVLSTAAVTQTCS